jgi:hypothetical protein
MEKNNKENSIILFKQKQIRRKWVENQEKWYFSIIDIISILTNSSIPKRYWSDLKFKLEQEGSQVYDKIVRFKMEAADGKMRLTDCLNTEDVLRLVQSIPSPKAEPFKLWLAKIGYERIEETEDPELGIDRAMQTYLKKGVFKILANLDWRNNRVSIIFINIQKVSI